MTLGSYDRWTESDRKSIREQMDRIVGSTVFAGSPRRQNFLQHVVRETLAGRGERLKGYSIALAVFGRPDTFDPNTDPLIRIEAGRLRDKLRVYYDTVGLNDPVHIELPRGAYKPRMTCRRPHNGDEPSTSLAWFLPANTRELEAHSVLLKGLGLFWRYTREACADAQGHFAEAVGMDPRYASAHAWLARTYIWQACMNWVPAVDTAEAAREHACLAVEIDPRSQLGHSVLGKVLLSLGDAEGAITAAERACALEPNSAEAKMFLAFILAASGRGQEALRLIETAILLQAFPSSYFYETLGLAHFAIGDYARATDAFSRGIDINGAYMPCHYELAVAYGVHGRIEDARAEAAIVTADCPTVSAGFILDRSLAATYRRGKRAAGLM